MKIFDVVIIGGGPAGYTSSIRCSQLGLKTACIDNWKINNKPALGGTCANVGCIPSKVLLKISDNYQLIKKKIQKYGIEFKDLKLNLTKTLKYKNSVINKINNGILYLFKKNFVTFFHGEANFLEKEKKFLINIKKNNKNKKILSKHVIIATGSKPKKFKNISFDEKLILSNSGALNIKKKIKNIGIIGGGVIALEIGSIWKRFGINIDIFENSNNFLNSLDNQISKQAYKFLIKQGLNIYLSIQVINIKVYKDNVCIKYLDKNKNINYKLYNKVIVSIGRKANFGNLNIKNFNFNLKLNNLGFIDVNNKYQTNIKNLWAIGDVIGGQMLAHKSQEEGILVAENIIGKNNYLNYKNIPSVIYTTPEIAWVGYNEKQLKLSNIPYILGTFPILANSKSHILGNTQGIIKFLVHAKTDKILGVYIISILASELISNIVIAIEYNITVNDLIKICFAHPSLSEIFKEVSMSTKKRSINF